MAERILFYDCSAGISGDMHLGALVDLGVPVDYLERELGKLGLAGWRLHAERDSRRGIGGTRVDVLLDEPPGAHSHSHDHEHPHDHDHEHSHDHDHAHESGHHHHHHEPESAHDHAHGADHDHRAHRDIIALIERSGLSAAVQRRSLAIFARVATAEAKIHGMPVAEVCFHEVGAVDSIVDIVGAAVALDWLKPDRIIVSTVELGSGFVMCAHGRLPVPAPATVEILRGAPTRLGTVPFEATTPTGAAILAACADEFTDQFDGVIERIGYGIGHRDSPIPNVLRVFLAAPRAAVSPAGATASRHPTEAAVLLECNLDDMTGEVAGHALERLLAAGASDVWITPIVMKKSRPGIVLSVLCPPALEAPLTELMLRETTTFGLRRREVGKLALARTTEEIATPLGTIRLKVAWLDGRRLKAKPEHADLQRLAAAHGCPLREVETALTVALARKELS